MSEHSPEPWKIDDQSREQSIEAANGFRVCLLHPADDYCHDCDAQRACNPDCATNEANRRRIVACVNFLKDIPTVWLERHEIEDATGLFAKEK